MKLKIFDLICIVITFLLIGVGIGMSIQVLGVEKPETVPETAQETTVGEIIVKRANVAKTAEKTIQTVKFEVEEVTSESQTSEEETQTDNRTTTVAETLSESQTTVVESTTENIPVSEVETMVETAIQDKIEQRHTERYSVNGAVLSVELQDYLFRQLEARGHGNFMPIALCQIYQESRYNSAAIAPNGLDKGLCQFRETFFGAFAAESGLTQWDIMNPIDQLYVYAYLMCKYLDQTGSTEMALSAYYMGEIVYCDHYVKEVMQWVASVQIIG